MCQISLWHDLCQILSRVVSGNVPILFDIQPIIQILDEASESALESGSEVRHCQMLWPGWDAWLCHVSNGNHLGVWQTIESTADTPTGHCVLGVVLFPARADMLV